MSFGVAVFGECDDGHGIFITPANRNPAPATSKRNSTRSATSPPKTATMRAPAAAVEASKKARTQSASTATAATSSRPKVVAADQITLSDGTHFSKAVMGAKITEFETRVQNGEENVDVVVARNPPLQDVQLIEGVCEKLGKRVSLMLVNGDLLIIKYMPGPGHSAPCIEVGRIIGNWAVDHTNDELRAGGDEKTRPGSGEPDIGIFPMYPRDPVGGGGRSVPRAIVEIEVNNRDGFGIRENGRRFADFHGLLLRVYVGIKFYESNHAAAAVIWVRNAAGTFTRQAAISFGGVDLDDNQYMEWRRTEAHSHPLAAVPQNAFAVALHGGGGVPPVISIPAAAVWYQIRDGAGGFVPLPPGLIDCALNLHRLFRIYRAQY